MVDFSEIADLINDTITDEGLGRSITYTSVTAGAYDPATGTSTPTTSNETANAIIEDFKGLELLNGLVQAGDKKVSIAADALSATPKPTDTVTVDGAVHTIVQVNNIEAGGVVILHVLQCRRV